MGQVLLGGISALAQMKGGKEMPTPQEQTKIRDMVYKRVPQIRERIFERIMAQKVKCSHILVEKQSQALQIFEEIKKGKKVWCRS